MGRFLFLFHICIIFFAVTVGSRNSEAAQFSGEYLLHVCASGKDGKEVVPGGHIACQSYIAGVMDYHALLRSLGTAPSVDFCVPESVPMYDVQKRVYRHIYLNRRQHDNFTAAPAVALALFQAYPCGR